MSVHSAKQFMRTLHKTTLFLAVGALYMGIGASLRAAPTTIYDNSVNDLSSRFVPVTYLDGAVTKTREAGDEIILAGTDRWLTGFDFEYWGDNSVTPGTFAGAIQAQVRLYKNDGPLVPPGGPPYGYPSPGATPFYDSGLFSLGSPTDRSTMVFTLADFPGGDPLFIPADDITWTVEFIGLGTGDSVGLDIYSPPVVGQGYSDYWQYNGGWSLMTNTVPMDFGARFYAQATIPEPSTLTLSIMGGLGILTLTRRLRRKE
jgi:hypothetical protein